jgi:hypothetical protein
MKRHIKIINLLLTLVIVTLMKFGSVQPANAQDATLTLNFAKLGYGDLRMQSIFGSASIWVPIRSDWDIQKTQVSVQLKYVASPLLIPESSTMTISAGGSTITSWRPVTDGQPHTIEFKVPTSKMSTSDNGFLLMIQGFLVIDKELCQTTDDPGQWVMILNDSSVSFNASLDISPPRLEELADEIVVKNSIGIAPPPVLFILPKNPDSVDLTAAGEVAARLSREGAKTRIPLIEYNVTTIDTLQPEFLQTANLVIIGEPTRNSLIQDLRDSLVTPLNGSVFTTIDNFDTPIEDGVIQLISLPWAHTRRALIVSGGSPEGVAMAGNAFAHSPTFHSLEGKIKFVHALEPVNESDTNPAWQEDKTSFAQLQFGTRIITGVGTYDEQYLLEFPPGWVLLPGSQLVLEVASSPALSSEQSHIAVFLDGLPIGTVTIGENTQNTAVVFDLPVQQINLNPVGELPHKMALQMSVTNYLRRDRCSALSANSAWTQISDSSYFVTTNVFMTVPDLQAFPYPFVNDDANSTIIIIPERPTNDEIQSGLNLASTLGRYTPSDFSLKVITADKATQASMSQSNLIIIGTLDRNPLINEFNSNMGELNNPGVYDALKNTSNGLIREGPSLWNENLTALLIFANTQEGVNNAALGLFDSAPPLLQSGTLAIVEANQSMRILEAFKQPQLGSEELGVSTPMLSGEESGQPEVAPSSTTNGTEVSELAATQLTVGEENQRTPARGQSLSILLFLLALLVLAIPFTLWLTRNGTRS